jgi:hypothetical protein
MSEINHRMESIRDLERRLESKRQALKRLDAKASEGYSATGQVVLAFYIFGGTLDATLAFGTRTLLYHGSFGGLGAGGGTSKGSATFLLSPDELLDLGSMSFQFTGSTSRTLVQWYQDGDVVGSFSGSGTHGGGEAGGNGSWTEL